jgi:hypothetical protein
VKPALLAAAEKGDNPEMMGIGITVTWKWVDVVINPSLTLTVTTATPDALGPGVRVNERSLSLAPG